MATVQIPDLPDNSYKTRMQKKPGGENPEKPQEKNLQKVVSGKVINKKKSIWVRMKERFFEGSESMDLKDYMVDEVFVPGVKNLLGGIVEGIGMGIMDSFNMAIFGTTSRRRTSYDRGRYTNYGSYYNGGARRRDEPRATSARSKKTFDDVILETRKDADDVLKMLFDVLERYGRVSVADLNELIGVSGEYTDNYWGWDNLESADIKRVREGYLLILPDVISLKD